MDLKQKLERIVASVQLLAADADVQLSAFPDFVCKPDEIVLTFGECEAFVPELARAGLLSAIVRELLRILDERTVSLGGGTKSIWTESAVRKDPEWADLRQLARATLKEMGEAEQAPDLGWMTFVPGPEGPKDPV